MPKAAARTQRRTWAITDPGPYAYLLGCYLGDGHVTQLLGIRVTQPNHRNLAVQHRKSVAILERIVGPKH